MAGASGAPEHRCVCAAGACPHACHVPSHRASGPSVLCHVVTPRPCRPHSLPGPVRLHLWAVLLPHSTTRGLVTDGLRVSPPRGRPRPPCLSLLAHARHPLPFTGPGSPAGSSPPRSQWWRPWLDHATGTAPTWLPRPPSSCFVLGTLPLAAAVRSGAELPVLTSSLCAAFQASLQAMQDRGWVSV